MSASALLDRLTALGVSVDTDGDTLRIKADKGTVSSDLLAELRDQKPALIALLTQREGTDYPQSFGQKQLWFLDRMEPGNPMYNNPLALRLEGAFDMAALRAALAHVAGRHDILRTVFLDKAGAPFQRVLTHARPEAEHIDLSHLHGPTQDDALAKHVIAHARHAFDLERDLPLRVSVVRLAEAAHVLLVNVHHICADGWSVGILIDELMTAYHALARGGTPDLPALDWQYSDFATHQNSRLTAAEVARQTSYWQSQLAGAPDLLELPTDRPRPAEQGFAGAHLLHALPAHLKPGIAGLCKAAQVTPFAVFLAVHALVVARFSGQDDICTGTPLAGRDLRALEPMIGHFINTVVIRTQLAGNPDFATLLTRVNDTVLNAMDHQDIAFEKVVEAVNPARSASHAPLFQTMLIFQNTPEAAPQSQPEGLKISPLPTDSATAKYDITVELFETQDSYQLGFEYNSDLFDRRSIATMAAAYDTLLAAVIADPERPVDAHVLCPPVVLHGATRDSAEPATLHARFDKIATQFPDRIAVEDGTRTLNFATLAQRSTRTAQLLRQHGVAAGARVALAVAPDAEYVTLMLGVLKCGAAFVPIDAAAPLSRMIGMLADAGVSLTCCSADLHAALGATDFDGARLITDDLDGLLAECPDDPTAAETDTDTLEDSTAAIIFTSGSTGRPKGVQVRHAGLVNLADWSSATFPPAPYGAVLQKTAPTFDASLWEFFWPLLSGQKMVMADSAARSDPGLLPALITKTGVTSAQFVPATLHLFLDGLDGRDGLEGYPCPDLKHIFCGGGILSDSLARTVSARLPHADLINVYGVSESSVDSTFHRYDPDEVTPGSVPIGLPIDNSWVTLLDSKGRAVPAGVIGEMYIGGAGVGAGYVGTAGERTQAFAPLALMDGQIAYRSGDRARINARGVLEFHGRSDFQIKLNGFRIEPGDIEAALVKLGATGAVATRWQDRLIAYVTGLDTAPETGSATPSDAVRTALKPLLPAHMIPAFVIPLDAFVLTPSGKIDRQALPTPEALMCKGAVNQTTPRDITELGLYDIWKEILLHPAFGIRDNFFNIGGASISAIKMLHLVRQKFGVTLPLRSIIANPTIEDLAAVLRKGNSSHTSGHSDEDARITFRRGTDTGTNSGTNSGTAAANVVCVHPAGGTAFCYLSLAKVLDAAVGVYGVQSPGLNPGEALSPTVETMAEHYLELIDDIKGAPLILTGLSFGGLVAHEMGRRLAAAGKTDVSVVLLDTQGTHDTAERRRIDTVDMAEFRDKLVRFNGTYPGIEDAQIERYFNVYNHNRLTVRDYEVPVSGARTAFVQARSDVPRVYLHEARAYWKSRTTGAFRARLVRGDHWDMLETTELETVRNVIAAELDALSGGTGP
jgi:amino acid adenylation domain-containing protein